MANWTLAPSLAKLRDQLNAAYPNRSKASDGTIGDVAHAATVSDHNPNSQGIVAAFDITHDPANGVDIDTLSDVLAGSHDKRIKYLIANRLIMVPDDYGDWNWHPYSGADPHTNHLHVSVYGDYNDTSNWNIGETNMAENFGIDAARVINFAILGRDGRSGRINAVTGANDSEVKKLENTPITNGKLNDMFWSDEAKAARADIDNTYAERDALKKQLADIKKQGTTSNSPSAADKAVAALKEALK